jgi:rhamnosyltransferase
MVDNLFKVSAQVQDLIVVDNGSDANEIDTLRLATHTLGFHLIENRENLGLAQALNQGVRWAKNKNHSWVIFFDQDSQVTEGFVAHLLAAWKSHPKPERLGAMHPRYLDPATGSEFIVWRASDGGPVVSMTSGALMPAWIFDKVGVFASEYFIDCVDFEFCFRLRAAGYLIADSRDAVLMHAAGAATGTIRMMGLTFRPTNHSPARRYYMSRNRIAMYRKYFTSFPRWILRSMNESLGETIKCFLGEEDRARKFRSFLLGTWDGLMGRMGKRDLESDLR